MCESSLIVECESSHPMDSLINSLSFSLFLLIELNLAVSFFDHGKFALPDRMKTSRYGNSVRIVQEESVSLPDLRMWVTLTFWSLLFLAGSSAVYAIYQVSVRQATISLSLLPACISRYKSWESL